MAATRQATLAAAGQAMLDAVNSHFIAMAEIDFSNVDPITSQRQRDRELAYKLMPQLHDVGALSALLVRGSADLGQWSSDETDGAPGSAAAMQARVIRNMNDDAGYYHPNAINESAFLTFLHATGLMSDSCNFTFARSLFSKHAVVMHASAHAVHNKRRFAELVDADGFLPAPMLHVLVNRAAVAIPNQDVVDYIARTGTLLTWRPTQEWLDEWRQVGHDGSSAYPRDGTHPANDFEAGVSGLTKSGFVCAIRELAIALCPPSPWCACPACTRNREASAAGNRSVPWASAMQMTAFAAVHTQFVCGNVIQVCARALDASLRTGAWPMSSSVGQLLRSRAMLSALLEYERPLAAVYNYIVQAERAAGAKPFTWTSVMQQQQLA
ncbi:hypothetical protein EON66_11235, partial [archaeon]